MNHLNEHKGTYRTERFPKALHPDYFKLDERSDKELIAQTAKLASYIAYYNEQNQLDGNWEAFFEDVYDYAHNQVNFQQMEEWEKTQQTPPHLALFLAFVQVFHIAQDELNRLSQRHLEYYYNNILKFEREKAVEDKVALFFELDKKATMARVPKGTLFDGGNDNNGKKRLYASDYDVVVNKAEIRQVKTLTADTDTDERSVRLSLQEDLLTGTACNPAEIGIALSSPMFYLADGDRTVMLYLKEKYKAFVSGISNNVSVYYTGKNGWEEIHGLSASVHDGKNCLELSVNKSMPSFVRYDETRHGLQISAKDPVLRFVFHRVFVPEGYANAEEFLATFTADILEKIEVNVEGSKDLLLYNDYGKLNGNMTFMPFGPNPIPGVNHFYLGNNKIFNRYFNPDFFSVNVDWKGLPENMGKYYVPYKDAWPLLDKRQKDIFTGFNPDFSDFKKENLLTVSSCLDQGEWTKTVAAMDEIRFCSNADSIRETSTEFTAQTKTGFIQVDLNVDFGHSVYSTLLSKVLMENVRNNTDDEHKNPENAKQYPIPEKPYTPEIQSISIDYRLAGGGEENDFDVFSLHPFANREVRKEEALFPILADEKTAGDVPMRHCKTIYMALANVRPLSEVNVYFDMSANIPYQDSQHFIWGYYDGEKWNRLDEKMIVRDTTNMFHQSGIITFIIPETMPLDGKELFWLCLSMFGKEKVFPEILKVRAHCVIATFRNQENELSHLKFGLPANTIQKMEVRNNDIKTVEQPYPSFDGKEEEGNDDFYARISERLRHKNRASTAWDYEHLVLEKFPQISFVLCLSHSLIADERLRFTPGHVTLLVSPDPEMLPQDNPLQPYVPEQMLTQIRDYVKNIASPHVDVSVMNFAYRPVRVHCEVQLKKGYSDTSFYHDRLNADLVEFMSPWTAAERETEKAWMYQSRNVADLYFFIENLEYIDFVINAYVEKDGKKYTIADKSFSDDVKGIGKEPFEIFTSDTNHDISIVYNG